MNDFDNEFIASEVIELTDNQGNLGTLILEAKIRVVDKGTRHTKELDTKKREKNRRKYPDYPEKLGFCKFLRKNFF